MLIHLANQRNVRNLKIFFVDQTQACIAIWQEGELCHYAVARDHDAEFDIHEQHTQPHVAEVFADMEAEKLLRLPHPLKKIRIDFNVLLGETHAKSNRR